MKKKYRILHKWIGVLSCLFMLIVASTALLLNHHDLWFQPQKTSNAKFNLQQSLTLATDPFDPMHMMGSDLHHLFESRDQGKNWQEIKLFIPAENINHVVFSPKTKDLVIVSLKNVGLYISEDSGEIWEELDTPFNPLEGEIVESLDFGLNHLSIKTPFALYSFDFNNKNWSQQNINSHQQSNLKTKDIIYQLHTGQLFGEWGLYFYDLISLALILLSVTGLLLAWRPKKKIAKIKAKELKKTKELLKTS